MSEIDVRGTLEALRPLGRQARAAIVLSEKLESLVGLEDFSKELGVRVEKLKVEVAGAEKAKAGAEAGAVKVCADAKAKADKILVDASGAAEKCLADAEKEAKAIVGEAKADAAKLKTDNDVLRSTGKILQGEVDKLTAQRDTLNGDIESLRAVASRIVG